MGYKHAFTHRSKTVIKAHENKCCMLVESPLCVSKLLNACVLYCGLHYHLEYRVWHNLERKRNEMHYIHQHFHWLTLSRTDSDPRVLQTATLGSSWGHQLRVCSGIHITSSITPCPRFPSPHTACSTPATCWVQTPRGQGRTERQADRADGQSRKEEENETYSEQQ